MNKSMKPTLVKGALLTGLAAIAFAVSPMAVSAQVPAMTWTSAPTSTGSFVLGWQFSTTNFNVQVTALGVFDNKAKNGLPDGLVEAHTVGIYNSVGTLLVSVVVPAGSAGTLNNFYRYSNISPIVLAANSNYTIADTNVNEVFAFGGPGTVPQPPNTTTGIHIATSNAAVFNANGGATLAFPTVKPNQPTGYTFFGGPNFLVGTVTPAGTPEPGAAALLIGSGTTGVLFLLRRRRK
jgi:hypothetical protein